MPTQVELEVPLQSGTVEQGVTIRGKDGASMQPQCATNKQGPCVQTWSIDSWTSPLSALHTASARQGEYCYPSVASSRGRQSHQQSSLPPVSVSLHLTQSESTVSYLYTPPVTSTNTLQCRGRQLKEPKGAMMPQRQSFDS